MFFDTGVPFPHHWCSILHLWREGWLADGQNPAPVGMAKKSRSYKRSTGYSIICLTPSCPKKLVWHWAILTHYLPHCYHLIGFEKKWCMDLDPWVLEHHQLPPKRKRPYRLLFFRSAPAFPDTQGIDFDWKLPAKVYEVEVSHSALPQVGMSFWPLGLWHLYIYICIYSNDWSILHVTVIISFCGVCRACICKKQVTLVLTHDSANF